MTLEIDGRKIGPDHPPYIIAEVSGNHNGDIKKAIELIEIAKECGADAVKIQTYTPDTMTIKSDKDYFKITEGPWAGYTLYDLYEWAHTPWEWHQELFDKAKEVGISIFSSPFDETAVDFLEELGAPAYKVASFEATDVYLLEKIISTKKPVIISTGMASEADVEDIMAIFNKHNKKDVAILHCVSGYPTPVADSNINAIKTLVEKTGLTAGLSDHTLDLTTSIMAVAMGANVIEKHFIDDRGNKGPDSAFSLEPKELKQLVDSSKLAWQAKGDGSLKLRKAEEKSAVFRRSLFFVEDIKAGEVVTEKHVRRIRPGYGLPPKHLPEVLGKKVKVDITQGEPVSFEVLES